MNFVLYSENSNMLFKLIIAISVTAATGIVIYALIKNSEKLKRVRVAEEGYETAYDILFTKKKVKKHRVA